VSTEKTLPEIYREAAELVLKDGKVTGQMKKIAEDRCFGFCTMGAVFEASGNLEKYGSLSSDFDESDEYYRLVNPVANQITESGRLDTIPGRDPFWVIADWNDNPSSDKAAPSAEDVAVLLRETADRIENGDNA